MSKAVRIYIFVCNMVMGLLISVTVSSRQLCTTELKTTCEYEKLIKMCFTFEATLIPYYKCHITCSWSTQLVTVVWWSLTETLPHVSFSLFFWSVLTAMNKAHKSRWSHIYFIELFCYMFRFARPSSEHCSNVISLKTTAHVKTRDTTVK